MRSNTRTLTLLFFLILVAGLTRVTSLRFFLTQMTDDDSVETLGHRAPQILNLLDRDVPSLADSSIESDAVDPNLIKKFDDVVAGLDASVNKLSGFVLDTNLRNAVIVLDRRWSPVHALLLRGRLTKNEAQALRRDLDLLRNDVNVVMDANDNQRVVLRSRMWTAVAGVGIFNLLTILLGMVLTKRSFTAQRIALGQLRKTADMLQRSENELRAREAQYRALVENMDEILVRVETQGGRDELKFIGPQLQKALGYKPGDFIEKPTRWLRLIHRDDLRPMLTKRAEVLGGATVIHQCRVRHKNGDYVWFEAKTGPVYDENGKVTGIQILLRDIHKRRQVEEEGQRLERQLHHAQKMETVGRLAGGVAHDFNNALTIILGYSRMLLERLDAKDPNRSYIDSIRKAGERAANTARQLSAFSRKTVLQPVQLDLNTSARNTTSMLRRIIGEHIELRLDLAPQLETVEADAGHMDQILMNLVVNARDAMPSGGTITIMTRNVVVGRQNRSEHPDIEFGSYVMLSVADDGVGMDEETKKHIFEPFFTTKEVDKGTGLGLATVYGIIRQSKGQIGFSSEAGCGTEFRIYLPRVRSSVVPSQNSADSSTVEPLETGTVLLVEDEDDLRALVGSFLRRNGYTVIEAQNGNVAIEALLRPDSPIDVLLTDMIMPGITGKELAARALVHHPQLKVLYMSGYARELMGQRPILTDDDQLINKPFSEEDLLRKLRNISRLRSPSTIRSRSGTSQLQVLSI